MAPGDKRPNRSSLLISNFTDVGHSANDCSFVFPALTGTQGSRRPCRPQSALLGSLRAVLSSAVAPRGLPWTMCCVACSGGTGHTQGKLAGCPQLGFQLSGDAQDTHPCARGGRGCECLGSRGAGPASCPGTPWGLQGAGPVPCPGTPWGLSGCRSSALPSTPWEAARILACSAIEWQAEGVLCPPRWSRGPLSPQWGRRCDLAIGTEGVKPAAASAAPRSQSTRPKVRVLLQ